MLLQHPGHTAVRGLLRTRLLRPIRLGLRVTPRAICACRVWWCERDVQVSQLRRSRRCRRFCEQALPLRGTQSTADPAALLQPLEQQHCSVLGACCSLTRALGLPRTRTNTDAVGCMTWRPAWRTRHTRAAAIHAGVSDVRKHASSSAKHWPALREPDS